MAIHRYSTSDPGGNVSSAWHAAVRRLGSRPFLTFYNGEDSRTELSYATFDNWASKTANLLVEHFDVQRGATVAVAELDDWTAAVLVTGAWKAGARTALGPWSSPPGDADVVVMGEDAAAGAAVDSRRLLVLGTAMGGRVQGEVPGVAFGQEVLAFADDYDDPDVSADDPLAHVAGRDWSLRDLLSAAPALTGDDRLAVTASLSELPGLLGLLVAPLAAGASVVWMPDAGARRAERIAEQERVTCRLLVDGTLERG